MIATPRQTAAKIAAMITVICAEIFEARRLFKEYKRYSIYGHPTGALHSAFGVSCLKTTTDGILSQLINVVSIDAPFVLSHSPSVPAVSLP